MHTCTHTHTHTHTHIERERERERIKANLRKCYHLGSLGERYLGGFSTILATFLQLSNDFKIGKLKNEKSGWI